MKEFRKINIITNRDGHGSLNFKISLPKTWADKLGFSELNKNSLIEFDKNKIVIRKERINMLLIKKSNFERVNHLVDYELENGILLYESDWNGEIYLNGFNPFNEKDTNISYKPVYKFELDEIDISEIEENSDTWNELTEIVGFTEL